MGLSLPRIQFRRSGAVFLSTLFGLPAACVSVPDRSPPAGETGSSRWQWEKRTPLPRPLSNNAVAAVEQDGVTFLYSFMGIDESKSSSGITGAAYRYHPGRDDWENVSPVPGTPRLGATAQSVEGKIYLFDPGQSRWEKVGRNILPTMDHRGLAGDGDTLTLIGGMTSRGRVTSKVETLSSPRETGGTVFPSTEVHISTLAERRSKGR